MEKPIQHYYSEETSHCYGCGHLNEHGLQIQTFWEGDGTVARFQPKPYHTAIPGFVYGGLIASLVDCHGTGSAALAAYREAGRAPDTEPAFRFVTGSLHVDYLKPTPMGLIELRGYIAEVKGRKVIVTVDVYAGGDVTAKGQVVAIQVPENWGQS